MSSAAMPSLARDEVDHGDAFKAAISKRAAQRAIEGQSKAVCKLGGDVPAEVKAASRVQ